MNKVLLASAFIASLAAANFAAAETIEVKEHEGKFVTVEGKALEAGKHTVKVGDKEITIEVKADGTHEEVK